jgi:hypothetical protein
MIKENLYKIKQQGLRFLKNSFKPYYKTQNNYWIQKVSLKRANDREAFFIKHCNNKNVVHFGCTDWPVFNSKNNLHIKLNNYAKTLHGFDIDKVGIENLKKYVNQNYYSDYTDILNNKYDVCLVPETIEHVDNVKEFLVNISKINADKFLITAPNCFAKGRHKRNLIKNDYMIELVHPDHNCWYSPYTLKNQIEKYSNLTVVNVYLLENERMICCEATKISD